MEQNIFTFEYWLHLGSLEQNFTGRVEEEVLAASVPIPRHILPQST